MKNASAIPWGSVRAWFFDLDGTLMDTDDQAVESLARRLRIFGPARSARIARRLVMMGETPMNDMITMLDIVGLDALLFKVQRRLQKEPQPTFRIIDGVRPMLEVLAAHAPLAVVSTRLHEAARAFLEQHALTDLFQMVVTQETTHRLKPHPEPILYAAAQLKVPPEACVMVGDTPMDVVSARRAGAWAVGVLCGFGEEHELRRSGAHLILPSTADLASIVQENLV
ncbi:MAG: HAD family hydrolase [Anaerolineae bacterium]|nr:HAD family hydrolase [Anaerolineae bacterium]